jgi:hypothetical protein
MSSGNFKLETKLRNSLWNRINYEMLDVLGHTLAKRTWAELPEYFSSRVGRQQGDLLYEHLESQNATN